jgi:hypothetical protein
MDLLENLFALWVNHVECVFKKGNFKVLHCFIYRRSLKSMCRRMQGLLNLGLLQVCIGSRGALTTLLFRSHPQLVRSHAVYTIGMYSRVQ